MNRKDPSRSTDPAPGPAELIADRYEVHNAIGAGGVGAVFRAWDTQLNRYIAVKRWNAPEPMLDDPEGTERLWREAMTLAAIQHPNILTIHDFGVDDQGPYVITEFIDGETLNRAVDVSPFDRETFAEAAQQILEGLIAAHQAGLIHRDLKPQNVMRTRLPSGAWQYKILDFGLARFITRPTAQSLEGNTSIYGSILYIAPEQLRHQPLDARTDIYAFGCLCYYMLAGHNAIDGDTIPDLIARHLEHDVKPLAEWRPDLPPDLCEWVMKALAFDPADRFPSAAAALGALAKILPGSIRKTTIRIALPGQSPPPSPPPGSLLPRQPLPRKASPKGTPATPPATVLHWAPAAAALLLVAAAIFVLVWHRRAPAGDTDSTIRYVTVQRSSPSDTTIVEAVITVWPDDIAAERRPLIQQYFELLRDQLDTKWGSTGFVLEALAVNQFDQALNTNEFKTINNLTYQDQTGRTLGELDVIIWNLRENRAVVVYEAAVSDRLHRKAIPSRNQLHRFERALQNHEVAKILHPYDDTWSFTPEQFAQSRFEVLGNQGAIAAGFDAEVDITRAETEFLQRKLIDWRKARHTSQGPLLE
ncbi:MAG: serine/threonine-protein kinase [Kiritimatiellia bacterium]|nr:serine/threonine-protein kinase [Kiritimatiellia bacterium]